MGRTEDDALSPYHPVPSHPGSLVPSHLGSPSPRAQRIITLSPTLRAFQSTLDRLTRGASNDFGPGLTTDKTTPTGAAEGLLRWTTTKLNERPHASWPRCRGAVRCGDWVPGGSPLVSRLDPGSNRPRPSSRFRRPSPKRPHGARSRRSTGRLPSAT